MKTRRACSGRSECVSRITTVRTTKILRPRSTFGDGGRHRGMELQRGQHVLLVPDVHAAVAPRIGQLQRFEVVAQTSFPGPRHRHQTEVPELRARVYGPFLAFDQHGHVQLLQEQLDYFARRRGRAYVQFEAGRVRQASVVRGVNLNTVNR